MIAWSTFAASAGRCGDLVRVEARRRRPAGAPARISSPRRERSSRDRARRARAAPRRRPGRRRRGRRSASARRRPARRRCGARARARSASRAEPLRSIWCTTSSRRCSRTARSPGRTTERRDWEVNIGCAEYRSLGCSPSMSVPLFDTNTPLAPLRDEIDAKLGRGPRQRAATSSAPRSTAFEREFAAYLGARHAIGVANGTDALTIALRALGVGPGDEVVVPSFTFYASRRGDPADRRAPGLLRRRSRDVLRHAGDGAGRDDAAHEGRDRRAPVRQRRAGRRDRGARRAGASRTPPRPPARSRADGRPRRLARHDRDVLVLPVEEPRRVRRRRRGRDERRRARRARADAALPRLARQGDVRARRLQLAPRRAAGRAAARHAAAPRPLVRRPPRRRRGLRGGGPRRGRRRCREPADGRRPAWHLYVVRHPQAGRRSPRRSRRPRSATRPTTACRRTASRRCASTPPAPSCRSPTSSRARTSRSR